MPQMKNNRHNNEEIPETLRNLSKVQKKNLKTFKWLQNHFYMGREIDSLSDENLFIGISDGHKAHITIGEVDAEGNVQLMYPDANSIDAMGFRTTLHGVGRLKEILEEKRVNYATNINKNIYIREIERKTQEKTSSLVSKIL